MYKPALSVVVSTFNSELFIQQCLDSIINQDISDFELLILDGGSTDSTVSISKEYAKKFTNIRIFEYQSLSFPDALNKGLGELSRSEYLTFINSDDYYITQCFKKVFDVFSSDPSIDIIQCEGTYVNSNGEYLRKYPSKLLSFNSFVLSANSDALQPAVFFKKDLFARVGGISVGIKCLVDLDLWSKMLLLEPKVIFLRGFYVAAYRLHSTSFTVSGKDIFIQDLNLYIKQFQLKIFQRRHMFLFFNYLRLMNYYRETRDKKLTKKFAFNSLKMIRFQYLFEYKKMLRFVQIILITSLPSRWD